MNDTRTQAIRELFEPVLAEHRAELVELTCHSQGGRVAIRLLVDKVGGVTIHDCARINQHVNQTLADSNLMGEDNYVIEVSSPGLDRPLTTKRDYERAVGEDLQLILKGENGKLRDSRGMLLAVQPEAIVLQTPAGNVTLPMSHIQSAKKAIRF